MKKHRPGNLSVIFTSKILMIIVGAIICSVLLGGSMVYFIEKGHNESLFSQVHPIFVSQTSYKLIRPMIGISLPGDLFTDGFPDVRDQIKSIVSAKPQGTIERYSVYLRDLNSGNWTGINENDQYDPASMLKVVVAIAAYRQAQNYPIYLTTPLVYTAELAQINTQIPFAQTTDLRVGQSYLVPFLIKNSLTLSDNGAVDVLLSSLPDQTLNAVYDQLSVARPNENNPTGYKLTSLEYSRFFRILYNGTSELNWANSEQILEDLATSTFTSGLVAGVPSTIPVAHKYGEHISVAKGVVDEIELSDCGIVYIPNQPFFLCIMTQGKDINSLTTIIAQISKVVYEKMSTAKAGS